MPSSYNGEFDPDEYEFRKELAPYDYRQKKKKKVPKKKKKQKLPKPAMRVTGIRG